jgi:hypothetical protein
LVFRYACPVADDHYRAGKDTGWTPAKTESSVLYFKSSTTHTLASVLMLQRRGKFGYKEMQKCRRMATHQQLSLNKKVSHHIGAGSLFSN